MKAITSPIQALLLVMAVTVTTPAIAQKAEPAVQPEDPAAEQQSLERAVERTRPPALIIELPAPGTDSRRRRGTTRNNPAPRQDWGPPPSPGTMARRPCSLSRQRLYRDHFNRRPVSPGGFVRGAPRWRTDHILRSGR